MYRILLLLPLVFALLSSGTQQPQKRALIIAIGEYEPSTGWKKISSGNDIKYVRSALESQGFDPANIDTLVNEKATKLGILAAIDKLIAASRAGDIVVFHFSGHGQQIFDAGKKDEVDGYDEAIVPYNANMRYSPGVYTGQNHITDDELGEKFKQLRKAIGAKGNLLVLLDACHSGTATRGQEIAITRGTDEKFEPEGYEKTVSASRGAAGDEGVFDDKELLSNMVVFSAASAEQLNYETTDADKNGVGSLTYAFSRAITQMNGVINYKILFEKVKADIQSWKPFQSPQVEGNTDQQVFGGNYIKSGDLIRINQWNADNTVEIGRGAIHSITKGAKFKVYPVDVIDFAKAKPVAEGVVIDAGMVKCTGSFTTEKPAKGKPYNVVFESRSFGDMAVGVRLALTDKNLAGQLRSKLQQYEYVSIDQPNADLSITTFKPKNGGQAQLQVVSTGDSVLWTKPWNAGQSALSEEEQEEIWQSVKQFTRAKFLRTINTPADSKAFEYVTVEFIPGIVRSVNPNFDSLITPKTLKDFTNAKGDLQFVESDDAKQDNEGFVIRVRNLHDYPIYLSAIDIMPDNSIAVLMPDPNDPNTSPEDFKIQPRQTFTSRPIRLYPPYGKDFMKILITREAMDLKSIQQRATTRSAASSFESFYNDSFKDGEAGATRGPKMAPVKVDEIKIVPFTYGIVKRSSK